MKVQVSGENIQQNFLHSFGSAGLLNQISNFGLKLTAVLWNFCTVSLQEESGKSIQEGRLIDGRMHPLSTDLILQL